jgi:SAM-dependent methyltransferase
VHEMKDDLVCPDHLIELAKQNGYLLCPSGCKFAIKNGIPRFIDDGYSEAFGFQWTQFPKTQLDSYSKTQVSRDRAVEAFGADLWSNQANASLLEVGCGAGRFTEVFLSQGAMVSSIDLSKAVDVNAQNFPQSKVHQVIQADVARLPYMKRTFDFVVCLGVIQHTPNPERTIQLLASYVKPGGWLVIDHYAKSIAWKLRTAPLVRAILKRLPPEVAFRMVESIYSVSKPFFSFSKNSKKNGEFWTPLTV